MRGHPDLPLPPTFLFSLELQHAGHALARRDRHRSSRASCTASSRFSYHRMAYAGDTLRFEPRIADIYDKKGGALDFVVRETRVTNQHGEHVADLRSVLVQRNG